MLTSTNGEYVGYAGTGSFTQSGGTNNASYLYLGLASTAIGTYNLSGGLLVGTPGEYVGGAGSGTFTQSGGANYAGQLSLAAFGGSGSYTLNSGLLNLYGLSRGTGATAFNVGAGTIQAGASFATSVPIVSNQLGSNAVFDTNGNAITLNAAFSGLGGLEKIGAGTLTLAVSNSYLGQTFLVAGTLVAANGNQGSATGANAVILNGGVLSSGSAGGTIEGGVFAGKRCARDRPGGRTFGRTVRHPESPRRPDDQRLHDALVQPQLVFLDWHGQQWPEHLRRRLDQSRRLAVDRQRRQQHGRPDRLHREPDASRRLSAH